MASYYQYLNELPGDGRFFSTFGRNLGYARNFFFLSLFSTWIFLSVLHFVYRKLNTAFIFFAPFLHLMTSLLVYLAADFILWISQLHPFISDFQKGFLITSISSTIIMLWFFGDVFKTSCPNSNSFIE
jgi:hypothetical protein